MEAARAVSEEMRLLPERNMQLQIPADFQVRAFGAGYSSRGRKPALRHLINTGIAHKEAGSQIGCRHCAGTAGARCFEQALEALAESMGIG